MSTFVQQAGVPFVRCAPSVRKKHECIVEQQRYLYDREYFNSDQSKEVWQIPVCLKRGRRQFRQRALSSVCSPKGKPTSSFRMRHLDAGKRGASGFYRSGYELGNIRSLARDVEKS